MSALRSKFTARKTGKRAPRIVVEVDAMTPRNPMAPSKALVNNGFVKVGDRVFHNSEFSLPGQVVGITYSVRNVRRRMIEVRWTNGSQGPFAPVELWKDTTTLVHRPGQVPFDRGTK